MTHDFIVISSRGKMQKLTARRRLIRKAINILNSGDLSMTTIPICLQPSLNNCIEELK